MAENRRLYRRGGLFGKCISRLRYRAFGTTHWRRVCTSGTGRRQSTVLLRRAYSWRALVWQASGRNVRAARRFDFSFSHTRTLCDSSSELHTIHHPRSKRIRAEPRADFLFLCRI